MGAILVDESGHGYPSGLGGGPGVLGLLDHLTVGSTGIAWHLLSRRMCRRQHGSSKII